MVILGIETTCDETGVGIVRDGREVLANIVSSSADLHKKYQGVVPEVAAREQVKVIIPVIEEALGEARKISNLDAIAVAHGPGLVGSLLIGVETAKTLAVVFGKPLIGVNHLVGHVYANWLASNPKLPSFPLISLIVSGGHTDLILMKGHQKYQWLGGTRDDAAGEAFDKVARVLGLGYPGGPEVEAIASKYQILDTRYQIPKFPRPLINEDNFDFSFSGLKTAVVNFAGKHLRGGVKPTSGPHLEGEVISAIAYEFQKAIVDVLVIKTIRAAKKFGAKSIVVGGGVAANGELRSQLAVHGSQINIPVYFPPKNLSVDNGTMIAAAAFYQKSFVDPLEISADPGLFFETD